MRLCTEEFWNIMLDPSSFHKHNITDTCSVWNVLSSLLLYARAKSAGVVFICTRFVIYECLSKPRRQITACETELQKRLRIAQSNNDFQSYQLDIDDLQTVEILKCRKQLGMGELSSLALALKTGQALLTDDQKARALAREVIRELDETIPNHPGHQTTPRLVGWLFFSGYLTDSDKEIVIQQHRAMNRPLEKYFCEMYTEALRCRCMAR